MAAREDRAVGAVNLRDAIGVALIGGFLFALGVLFWKAIPTQNEQLIVYMLGQLSGFAGAADAAVHTAQQQAPAGTPDDPVNVKENP
jgi:hypothetical protein